MERQSTSVVAGVAALCVGTFRFVFCGERGIESSNSPSALEEMVNPSLLRLAMVMFQTSWQHVVPASPPPPTQFPVSPRLLDSGHVLWLCMAANGRQPPAADWLA